MFIRITWLAPGARARNRPQPFRKLSSNLPRDCDDLGITCPDFDKMTRGLFERQD